MRILNNYLNELFGILAPDGDEVSAPVLNKMNSKISSASSSCSHIKDQRLKDICIKEKILKIKRDTRAELVQAISKCEGKKLCHKIIAAHTSRLNSEFLELEKEISQLKRTKKDED